MNRSEMREQAFVLLFEKEFFSELTCNDIEEIYSENFSELSDYAKKAFEETSARIDELDELIKKYLKGWKLERIPKVNISILRLALYEIIYEDGVPGKVAVNEAVELAKKYSGEDDYMFINGVLGSYLREEAK
ncbi:MAG: transcription antitermination factor NusB [Eubacterium sp.]|uniref:transcription antitermination factor NusB n=1 Tax=Eubacterium sp. TaxID=142586 RepID=UPI003A1B190F